jgi:hypothetical protein
METILSGLLGHDIAFLIMKYIRTIYYSTKPDSIFIRDSFKIYYYAKIYSVNGFLVSVKQWCLPDFYINLKNNDHNIMVSGNDKYVGFSNMGYSYQFDFSGETESEHVKNIMDKFDDFIFHLTLLDFNEPRHVTEPIVQQLHDCYLKQ